MMPQPAWVAQQDPRETKLIDEVLKYWEGRSDAIHVYECIFKRFKYDPVFLPPDPATGKLLPIEFSEGSIRYVAPDKAIYRDTKTQAYQPPKEAGGQPTWPALPEGSGHHWVCDGESIFEFDSVNQQLVQTVLPPELRGTALVTHGPLPFLFGAKAADIRNRYWLQLDPAERGDAEKYHLIAHPKFQGDAADFQMVKIVLDRKEFLPLHLIVYGVGYDPVRNPARVAYVFENRKVDPFDIRKVFPWATEFQAPKPPRGWKLVREVIPSQAPQQANATAQR